MTIKDAARLVDIKYENAKAIYRVYRKEKRTSKRRNRFRYKLPFNQKQQQAKAKIQQAKNQQISLQKNDNNQEPDSNSDSDSIDDEDQEMHEEVADDSEEYIIDSKSMASKKPKVRKMPQRTSKAQSSLLLSQLIKDRSISAAKGSLQKPMTSETLPVFEKQEKNVIRLLDNSGLENKNNNPMQKSSGDIVRLQNMASFSEQSSQFLQAKNLTAQSAVYSLPNDPVEPIKYDNNFFELLNQAGSTQSKNDLKSIYAAKFEQLQDSYQQKMHDYDHQIKTDLKRLKQENEKDTSPSKIQVYQTQRNPQIQDVQNQYNIAKNGAIQQFPQSNSQYPAQQQASQQVGQIMSGNISQGFQRGNEPNLGSAQSQPRRQDESNADCQSYMSQFNLMAWQMHNNGNQKDGEAVLPQYQVLNFANGSQLANQRLSQDMLDYNRVNRGVSQDQSNANPTAPMQTFSSAMQPQLSNEAMNQMNYQGGRRPSNFTTDLNQQMQLQQQQQQQFNNYSMNSKNFMHVSEPRRMDSIAAMQHVNQKIQPQHQSSNQPNQPQNGKKVSTDQHEEEKIDPATLKMQQNIAMMGQNINFQQQQTPQTFYQELPRVSSEFKVPDSALTLGSQQVDQAMQQHLTQTNAAQLNKSPGQFPQVMGIQRGLSGLSSGNLMNMAQNMGQNISGFNQQANMSCSPLPQSRYVSNDHRAADLAGRSPQKRVSQLFHNLNEEAESEEKRDRNMSYGQQQSDNLTNHTPSKKLTLPLINGLVQFSKEKAQSRQQSGKLLDISGQAVFSEPRPPAPRNSSNISHKQETQQDEKNGKQSKLRENQTNSSVISNVVSESGFNQITERAGKNTMRLPYMGLSAAPSANKQLSLRHVQECKSTEALKGNLDQITLSNEILHPEASKCADITSVKSQQQQEQLSKSLSDLQQRMAASEGQAQSQRNFALEQQETIINKSVNQSNAPSQNLIGDSHKNQWRHISDQNQMQVASKQGSVETFRKQLESAEPSNVGLGYSHTQAVQALRQQASSAKGQGHSAFPPCLAENRVTNSNQVTSQNQSGNFNDKAMQNNQAVSSQHQVRVEFDGKQAQEPQVGRPKIQGLNDAFFATPSSPSKITLNAKKMNEVVNESVSNEDSSSSVSASSDLHKPEQQPAKAHPKQKSQTMTGEPQEKATTRQESVADKDLTKQETVSQQIKQAETDVPQSLQPSGNQNQNQNQQQQQQLNALKLQMGVEMFNQLQQAGNKQLSLQQYLSHINSLENGSKQSSRPSEVSRYLLNQLEQVQIKLKSFGHYEKTSNCFDQMPDMIDSQQQSLEQTFTTIDNFSTNVLSLFKTLMNNNNNPTNTQQQVIDNQKMLHSLTQVIQIMHAQVGQVRISEQHQQQQQQQQQQISMNMPQYLAYQQQIRQTSQSQDIFARSQHQAINLNDNVNNMQQLQLMQMSEPNNGQGVLQQQHYQKRSSHQVIGANQIQSQVVQQSSMQQNANSFNLQGQF